MGPSRHMGGSASRSNLENEVLQSGTDLWERPHLTCACRITRRVGMLHACFDVGGLKADLLGDWCASSSGAPNKRSSFSEQYWSPSIAEASLHIGNLPKRAVVIRSRGFWSAEEGCLACLRKCNHFTI
ncbi:hypothetical protein PM082_019419 [Marasmius tenuissimus]|nr:hypothetical protein PM082_019419 [Marasmius tenuissimus]